MAGIPWGKYDRSDWRRVPGATRRYVNVNNPDITISRRQYDIHYGAASKYGSYERKAKAKSHEAEALLRPARGRTSARKLSPVEREVEAGRRRVAKQERDTEQKIARLRGQKHKSPTKIDLRSFKRGKIYRRITVDVSHAAVENVRASAARSGLVFGYYVGANLIDDKTGEPRTISAFPLRDIDMPFTRKDFNKLIKKINEKSYATLVSLWIHLTLKQAVAKNRNHWKGRS